MNTRKTLVQDIRWDEHRHRVEWAECRQGSGLFIVIAEWSGVRIECWERDSWEVRWYPLTFCPDRAAIAKPLFERHGYPDRVARRAA